MPKCNFGGPKKLWFSALGLQGELLWLTTVIVAPTAANGASMGSKTGANWTKMKPQPVRFVEREAYRSGEFSQQTLRRCRQDFGGRDTPILMIPISNHRWTPGFILHREITGDWTRIDAAPKARLKILVYIYICSPPLHKTYVPSLVEMISEIWMRRPELSNHNFLKELWYNITSF